MYRPLRRSHLRFLMLLLLADCAFIGVHIVGRIRPSLYDSPLFYINRDRGYAECFQYLKWFWIAILLAWQFASTRRPVYLALSAIFLYLLADDACGLHEALGLWLTYHIKFGTVLMLRQRDVGEALASSLIGGTVFAVVGLSFWRGTASDRRITLSYIALFLALGFFGVFADFLHAMVGASGPWGTILEVLEDGGEMIVASVAVWVAYVPQIVIERMPLPSLEAKGLTSGA